MAATLMFGLETEYAVSALGADGKARDRSACVEALACRLARDAGAITSFENHRDWFLPNGQRFYRDVGDHPECSTPECTSPAEAVCYSRAGDAWLSESARALAADDKTGEEIVISRCNVGYDAGSTWGSHESYLHTVKDFTTTLSPQLLPHLVSRIVFTGAGGFDNRSPGLRFMLAPRVAHLEMVSSSASTCHRGILHTKNEPLCKGGYSRLHLICGESLCSQMADYLRIGTTALVLAMIGAGMDLVGAHRLPSPLAAMRKFAVDEGCTNTVTVRGQPLRAIDIQRSYLSAAQANVGAAFMPAWAAECCERWGAVLDDLEEEAPPLNLDWVIKRTLFRQQAQALGIAWEHLPVWTGVLEQLGKLWRKRQLPAARIGCEQVEVLRNHGAASEVDALSHELARAGLDWSQLDRFHTLRAQLFETDTRFSQLGERGIFNRLDAEGVIEHRVVTPQAVRTAMRTPPEIGRARVRGELIGELAGRSDLMCYWDRLVDMASRRHVDLGDPFLSQRPEWQPMR